MPERTQAASCVNAEVPFELREGLIWVQVSIPQSAKPLNFMVDSGAGVSVINLHTITRLGLRLGNRVSVRGVQTTVKGYWPESMVARAGEVQLPTEYLAVDLGELSQSCTCAVDGLLGADFFKDRIVQIDYADEKMRLLHSAEAGANDESVPLETRACGMRVPIQVNGGKQQWVRLDTGCASALQWVTSPVIAERCSRRPAIGVALVSISMTETAVRIGKTDFHGVPTGLHTREIFAGEAGLLGNGLLQRFSTVTLDCKNARLILGKSQIAP